MDVLVHVEVDDSDPLAQRLGPGHQAAIGEGCVLAALPGPGDELDVVQLQQATCELVRAVVVEDVEVVYADFSVVTDPVGTCLCSW